MKRWIALAASLYPAAWRKRYGTEFNVLLEDVNPGWRELFDILGGALKMQLTTGVTYGKLGAAFALAGILIATIASFVIPKEYTSTAVTRMQGSHADAFDRAERQILSRNSLSQLIRDPALDLYPAERSRQPLEDVVEYMRTRAIHISISALQTENQSMAVSISYRYTDRKKAQAVVSALISQFAQPSLRVEVLDSPSLPRFASSPKRPEMLTTGLVAGLLLGLIAAAFLQHPRRSLVFASLGICGGLLGGASSLLIPDRYTSRAVLRVVPYDHNFEEALNRARPPNLGIHVTKLSGAATAVVEITDTDTDPQKARATVSTLVSTLQQQNIEYVDNANLPASPSYPNRIVISSLGLGFGLLTATALLLLQRRKPQHLF